MKIFRYVVPGVQPDTRHLRVNHRIEYIAVYYGFL